MLPKSARSDRMTPAGEADRGMPDDQLAHWNRHAEQWRRVGPPLRPTAEDVAYLRDRVAAVHLQASGRPARPRALLLGVTPEYASAEWRPELDLLAVDRSQGMIDEVWP